MAQDAWPPKENFLIAMGRGERRGRYQRWGESSGKESETAKGPESDRERESNRPLKGRFLTLRSGLGSARNWGATGANGFCILQLSDWAQRAAPGPGSTAGGGWKAGTALAVGSCVVPRDWLRCCHDSVQRLGSLWWWLQGKQLCHLTHMT